MSNVLRVPFVLLSSVYRTHYENDDDIYCRFHYYSRFATKRAGCNSAILKQFVEINRNNRDECWHSECYMINKENSRCGFADDC